MNIFLLNQNDPQWTAMFERIRVKELGEKEHAEFGTLIQPDPNSWVAGTREQQLELLKTNLGLLG